MFIRMKEYLRIQWILKDDFFLIFVLERGLFQDLIIKDIIDILIGVYWIFVLGMVRGYRVFWKSFYDDVEVGEKNFFEDVIYIVIENLQSEIKYKISVFVIYSSGEGEFLIGEVIIECR